MIPTPIASAHGSGIVIPEERDSRQRNYAYCCNPECAVEGKEFRFEVEHTLTPCPKCGANKAPMVGMLAKIHLIVRDPRGPFEGTGGLRYRIACDTKGSRGGISTLTNHELGTDDRTVCNCTDCLVEANKINAPATSGIQMLG